MKRTIDVDDLLESSKNALKILLDHAERYGDVRDWMHRFDAKIVQDVFTNFGTDRKYTLQVSLDMLNVGNMINDAWGTWDYHPLASFENIRPLIVVSRGSATTAPTFRLNANSVADFETKTTVTRSLSTSSTWGCLLGVRLIF